MPFKPGAASALVEISRSSARQLYAVTVQDSLRISNCITENTALFYFKKTLHQTTPHSFIFAIETVDFSQTNSHELGPLEEEMVRLKENLLLEVDSSGRLLRVVNKEELRRKWKAIRPVLKARYRNSSVISPAQVEQIGQILNGDGYLETVLARSPEYSILFPAIYDRTYTTTDVHRSASLIPRFVGQLDLPLRLETRLESRENTSELRKIVVEGFVNEATYPAEAVQQALRKLTDTFDLDTNLVSLHQESYVFDDAPLQEMLEATRYTRYEVPGVFGKEIVVLAQLLVE